MMCKIGVNGRQARFIKNHSKLEVFQSMMSEYKLGPDLGQHLHAGGQVIQTALLIESTLRAALTGNQIPMSSSSRPSFSCRSEGEFLGPLDA